VTFFGAPLGRPASTAAARASGRIVKLLVGQSYGYVRLTDGRDIYFHRADLAERSGFNALRVGDRVTFELLDDRISGARAVRLRTAAGTS
jgi:cold shock CspA family protein